MSNPFGSILARAIKGGASPAEVDKIIETANAINSPSIMFPVASQSSSGGCLVTTTTGTGTGASPPWWGTPHQVSSHITPYSAELQVHENQYRLVLQWRDGTNNQPIILSLGTDTSRRAVLERLQELAAQELAKEVLGA